MSNYPEHDRLAKVREEAEAIQRFLEWLPGQGVALARHSAPLSEISFNLDDVLYPYHTTPSNLTARYFGIDLDDIEMERREMLNEARSLNELCTK